MSKRISERVAELGLTLEKPNTPAANYVTFVQEGNLLYISGQTSRQGGKPTCLGLLGGNLSDEEGLRAAQLAGLGVIAQIAAATGDRLDRVARIVRLGVYVASTPDFGRHPAIANGASDLFVEVFGEAGRHARSAVGVSSLPCGVSVEVDAVVALHP